jgi:hypothetical protein
MRWLQICVYLAASASLFLAGAPSLPVTPAPTEMKLRNMFLPYGLEHQENDVSHDMKETIDASYFDKDFNLLIVCIFF